MRPDTYTAMQRLILEIRQAFPFDLDEAQLCNGPCQGCPKKLLEYMDTELCHWEFRMSRGETPLLGDLQRLAKTAHKIQRVLINNGIDNSLIINPS